MSISDNASGGLQTVTLSGTGAIVVTSTTIASSLNPSAFDPGAGRRGCVHAGVLGVGMRNSTTVDNSDYTQNPSVSDIAIAGSAAVKPSEDFEEPFAMIFGPVIFAFIANACYTLGWMADTFSSQSRPRVGLYKAGVVFSVVLTALPGAWAVVAWLMTLITGHKLD